MTAALFDDVGTATITNARPDRKTIQALEQFGFKADAVRTWTVERAETTLTSCRKEMAIALRHADDVARAQEEKVTRGQPTMPERWAAAACLEQAQSKGIDELSQCISYSVYVLSDDETKRLAGYLVRLMKSTRTAHETSESEIPD